MTTAKGWWDQATRDDASNCRRSVLTFLGDLNPDDTEKCARALALYILLGGDDTAICDKVDTIQESSHMLRVRDVLTACEANLSQAHVAMPEKLQKSRKQLIVRYEATRARRRLEILRAAGRIRILKSSPK